MDTGQTNKINREYYERNAKNYEKSAWYFFNAYKDNCVNDEIKKCLGKINKPEIKILEIGPGTGYLLSKIVKYKKFKIDYLGLEHSLEMSRILAGRYENKIEKLRINNNSVNSETVDLIHEKFDLIIGSSVLHHLPDYSAVIQKLAGKVEVGGIMYFVREPLGITDCKPSNIVKNAVEKIYLGVDYALSRSFLRRIFWPQKIRQEDSRKIAPVMYDKGISLGAFYDLGKRNFSVLSLRKYNRRVSSFFSYIENKWLHLLRKDAFGNTLFSIAIQKNV